MEGPGRNHSQQVTGTGQSVQQAQSRRGMGMPAVVALTTNMQMQVLMDFITFVVVFMAVQFEAEGGAHRQATDHQKRHAHQELRPGGHGLHMGQILDPDRDQRQHHHTDGVASTPGQTGPHGRQGLPQRERCHRHEVIGPTDHVNSTGGETGENADQHRTAPKTLILQDRPALSTDQRREGQLHILLTHQRLPHQHSPRTGRLDPIKIRAAEEAGFAHQQSLLLLKTRSELLGQLLRRCQIRLEAGEIPVVDSDQREFIKARTLSSPLAS